MKLRNVLLIDDNKEIKKFYENYSFFAVFPQRDIEQRLEELSMMRNWQQLQISELKT